MMRFECGMVVSMCNTGGGCAIEVAGITQPTSGNQIEACVALI